MTLGVVIPYRGVDSISKDLLYSISELTDRVSFVLVNDHSPDSAEQVIRSILGSSVHYVRNRGEGVADARNTGLNSLSTEWVSFIDSDDRITERYSDVILSALDRHPQVDVLRFAFFRNGEDFDSALEDINSVCAGLGYSVVWNKIYRRSFLAVESIRFPSGGGPFEDVTFLVELYSRSPRVLDIPGTPIYVWSVRDSSLTNSSSLHHLNQAAEQLSNCLRRVARLNNCLLEAFLIMRFFRLFYFKLRELQRDGPVAESHFFIDCILSTYTESHKRNIERYLSLFSYPTFNEVLAEFRRSRMDGSPSSTRVFETHDDAKHFSHSLNKIKSELSRKLGGVERVAIFGYGLLGKLIHSWFRPKIVRIYDKNAEEGVNGDINDLMAVDSNDFQLLVVPILGQPSVLDDVLLKRPDISNKILFVG